MSQRREVSLVLGAAGCGAVLLLVTEPATGVAVVAAAGAGTLLGSAGRTLLAILVTLLGAGLLGLAWSRNDPLLGAAAALVVAAASVTILRVRGWPGARRGPRDSAVSRATDRDTWDALDRGEDPTT